MSGTNPSVSSNDNVTITATSPVTRSIISAVFAAVSGNSYTYSNANGTTPSTPSAGATTFYVAPSSTGNVTIPAGFTQVLIDQTATVTVNGGDAATTVIGDGFTYAGGAAVVASGRGVAHVTDTAASADLAFGESSTITALGEGAGQIIQLGDGGVGSIMSNGSGSTILAGASSTTTINALASGDTVDIGNGAKTTVNLSGGDTINIGTGAPNSTAAGSAPVSVNSNNGVSGFGSTFNIAANQTGFATANVVLQLGKSDTVNVSGGVDSIFGQSSDRVNNVSGSVEFVGQSSASTIFGGTGQTSVFAFGGGQVFNVGMATQTSNTNVFVGGSAASTINAGTGGGRFFGGSHGDLYNIGTSSVQTFVGTGGNDTISGTAGSVAPTLFAIGGEHMSLTGTPQITVVAFEGSGGSTTAGAGGSVDASNTTANNVFFTGYGSTGNETLIGSTATIGGAHDIFELGAASLGGAAASSVPANITINNWHGGDAFFLIGYGAGDTQTMSAATSVSAQPGAASNLTFTLSDNTKVTFVGNHPTGFNASGNAIF